MYGCVSPGRVTPGSQPPGSVHHCATISSDGDTTKWDPTHFSSLIPTAEEFR